MPADPAWPRGVDRVILDEIDSTNAEAARRAGSYAGPVWILARRQTAGRGRRGRPWVDPEGNFAATLLCRPDGPPDQVALRSFVAALALFDALVTVTGEAGQFALKWPNDVLLNDGKLAGILLENFAAGAGGARCLAVGVGVNLRNAPPPDPHPPVQPAPPRPVSLKGETGHEVTPEAFLDLLAPAHARWEAQLEQFGFAHVRTAWLARAARLGQPLTARAGNDTFTGTFETLDDSGALVLNTPQGRRHIPAADVFFT
ncbi:biotin--[acetyl-CoA-carboxylase] ligase [Alkalilacustris brevis]|uniref:biotin--[acetyl-CoA-carboxylase] ligase n=1 Tax=Alkalilacustris brevis TaxID=2026338 RepID=UPI000E0D908C|nr:biotin--[acetyl-CoA-carboxylase] ligase [Alkalilacustris brevis]